MAKAKTLTKEQYEIAKEHVRMTSKHVPRDLAVLAFGFRSGLRGCEIAGMSWCDVLGPTGELVPALENFEVPNGVSKNKAGRAIPMHPELRACLLVLRVHLGPALTRGNHPIIYSNTGERFSASTLVRYINRLYVACGLVGVSSHSGRRTFITAMSRMANTHGCSIYDIQQIAGHSDVSTTAQYIDNSDRVGKLVGAL